MAAHWLKKEQAIESEMSSLVEAQTRGVPMGVQKWTRTSLRHVSAECESLGHKVSPMTVRRLLKKLDYSLKANVKRLTGSPHPDRDPQFKHIQAQKQVLSSPHI